MTTTTTLRAFHGDPAIKAKYLDRVTAHRAADRLVKGQYWKDGKGCAVGCTIEGSEHARYETELGIPRILARLEDRLFEGMANGASQAWPTRFLDAIPVGADLSGVWPRFAHWLLVDDVHGVLRFTTAGSRQHSAITRVATLYQAWIATGVRPAAAAAAAATADAAAAAAAAYAAAAAQTGCYLWTGSRTRNGYGQVRGRRLDGSWTVRKVHREVALRCFGVVACLGLDVDHRCGTRSCGNPRHLKPTVPAINRGWG